MCTKFVLYLLKILLKKNFVIKHFQHQFFYISYPYLHQQCCFHTYFPFEANVSLKKPVHWFAEKINGLLLFEKTGTKWIKFWEITFKT